MQKLSPKLRWKPLIYNIRNELREYLSKHNIGTAIFYPQSFTKIDYLNTHPAIKNACPIAEQVSNEIISLPIWPELEITEITHIANHINSFIQEYKSFSIKEKNSNPKLNIHSQVIQ